MGDRAAATDFSRSDPPADRHVSRAQLLVEHILPELFGTRSLEGMREMGNLPLLASGAVLLLSFLAIAWFITGTFDKNALGADLLDIRLRVLTRTN